MKTKAKMSSKVIIGVARDLRTKGGRAMIEPNFAASLPKRRDYIASFFAKQITMMKEGETRAVGCNSVKDYAEFVRVHRGIPMEDVGIKIGSDAGMGRLTTVLAVYDKSNVRPQKQQRVCRSDEVLPKNTSLLGPCKGQIVHSAPKVKDRYENLRPIYESIGVGEMEDVTFNGDCLYFNELFGKMSCSSTFPCYACNVHKDNLDTCGELIDFGMAEFWVNEFLTKGKGKRENGKDFFCHVEMPLVKSKDPRQTFLDLAPPPTLHHKLAVSHILKGMKAKFPAIKPFLASLSIVENPYYGEFNLNGNDVDTLFANLDQLEKLPTFTPDLQVFVDVLRDFKQVIQSCYGFTLDPAYKEVLDKFRRTYLKMRNQHGVTVSVKFHQAFFHVRQSIDKHGRALGEFR